MKTSNFLPLLLAGSALMLCGCYSSVNSVENANKEGQRQMVTDQRVVTDAGLNRKVFVVGVNTATTPEGLLKAQVELQNHTRSLQHFLYHFEWFDANGMQVNTILSTPLVEQIEGKESKFISCIAPNANCRDFRLKLIDAD